MVRIVLKTVESQGKVSEKSGNFEMDIEWQPCISTVWPVLLLLAFSHKVHVWK